MEQPQQGPGAPDDDSSMMATPDDSNALKRKRQPRNSACQHCAALKMKCISTDQGKCERCLRMDRDCVPTIPKARKRRTESGIGMESGETSMLEYAAGPPPPIFNPPRAGGDDLTSLLGRHDLSHTDSKSFVTLFSQGLGNAAAAEELLRGVDYNFVANCFTVFRQLTPQFPLVELSPGADVINHVARRPVLTLAICTIATASNADMQNRLSLAFEYALCSKVLLAGERSLDLLTGTMIYLAWNHQYLSRPQIYQKLSLLAAMAADLGLYSPLQQPLDPTSELERSRAFVGSYYLCSTLSAIAFDRPSPFRWTNNLRVCAERVATSERMPSDRSVVALLEMSHAIDEFEDTLRLDIAARPTNVVQMVELQVKAAIQRLKALKREHPSLGGSLVFAAAIIHCYQRLFRVSEAPENAALIQCACAAKDYIDDLLARPPYTLHRMSIIEWSGLLEVLVIMARITKPIPSASGWETEALVSMLQPEVALDAIYSHMASAAPNDPLSPRHEALLQWLGNACDGIRRRILHDGSGAPAGPHDFNYLGSGVLDMEFWNGLMAA